MDVDPDRKAKRMAEDIEMMMNPDRWPDFVLHLKTQPWTVKSGEWPVFGYMQMGFPLVVRLKDEPEKMETFSSIQELAERWSVD